MVAAAPLLSSATPTDSAADVENASPIYRVRLPKDYRAWQVVTAAHEAGALNDIRVVLGNDIALAALREGRRPLPDGAMLVRVAWKLVPSQRNNAVFGRVQSFVAGDPTSVQVEVKDSVRFATTSGWGYGQFENGIANPDVALMRTCAACHRKLPASEDMVFARYAP
jgi:hypothetical protein